MNSMVRSGEFVELVRELMAPLGEIKARAMFGGWGIYQRETMFAIVVADRLYLKADDATRSEFLALRLEPFTYVARGKTITLQYFEAPAEVFESPEAMQNWSRLAIGAALRHKDD